jgi:fucose 4-O-acetylase-like acetyltransferase
VAGLSTRPMNLSYLSRKSARLVLPFITWYAASYLINRTYRTTSLGTYWYHLVRSPDYGLWFLWVLFLNFCLLAVVRWAERYIGFMGYIVAPLAVNLVGNTSFGGLGLVQWYFPFFVAGYLLKRYALHISRRWSLPLAAAFLPLSVTWYRLRDPAFIDRLTSLFVAHHLGSVSRYVALSYRYAVASCGIIFAFTLIRYVVNRANVAKPLSWLGRRSLAIYAISAVVPFASFLLAVTPLTNNSSGSRAILAFSDFSMALLGAILLGGLLGRWWVTNLFLLGALRRKEKRPTTPSVTITASLG